jgi:hypothetical protein
MKEPDRSPETYQGRKTLNPACVRFRLDTLQDNVDTLILKAYLAVESNSRERNLPQSSANWNRDGERDLIAIHSSTLEWKNVSLNLFGAGERIAGLLQPQRDGEGRSSVSAPSAGKVGA